MSAYPWLPLVAVEAAIPAMEATGAAAVARGAQRSTATKVGFVEAYRFAEGSPASMARLPARKNETWAERRANFIGRHLTQVRKRGEPLFRRGVPTARMLGFLAWAYCPPEAEAELAAWFDAGAPAKPASRRNPDPPGTLPGTPEERLVMRLLVEGNNPKKPKAAHVSQRSHTRTLPALKERGLIRIVRTWTAAETDKPWDTFDVVPTRKLFAMVEQYDEEARAYQDTLQVGLFARRNPGRDPWRSRSRPGSRVQSVIFDAARFSAREARSWLADHDFAAPAADRQATTLRFRQADPDAFRPGSFRTIRLRPGVQAVVGLPR